MRLLFSVMLTGLLLGTTADAEQNQRSERKNRRAQHDGLVVHGDVRVVFSTGDVTLIRKHYAPQYRNLPPGQYKKLARTGTLPPGWQKKLQPFPVELERRLVGLPDGLLRGVINGQAVVYNSRTHVIVDVAVLF